MTEQLLECDVLIVGGGPAGLSVAAGLPKTVSSIVIHQDAEIGKPVRTSGGCWLSDVTQMGIPPEFYQVINHLDIYSDNQEANFPLDDFKMVVLSITELYQWLARKSDSHDRKLFTATKFLSTERIDDGQYLSSVRARGSELNKIKSKYIVDASGVRNAVIDSLGFVDKPDRVGVGIEYEYPIASNQIDRAILFVGSSVLSGYGWVFPTADHKLRVGVGVIHPDVDISPKTLMEGFLRSPAIQKFGLDLGDTYEVNSGTIPSVAYNPKMVFGNVIRVGDAANFATPTVGEGIRICIAGGEALGKALGDTIETNTTAPLKAYEASCNRHLKKNYYFGFAANQRFSKYSPKDWDKSIERVSRLSEAEMGSLLRSEFSFKMMLRAVAKNVKQKMLSRFNSTH